MGCTIFTVLALKYKCHINVEICASSRAAKYLHKYVSKGGDRIMMRVDEEGNVLGRNDVKEFQDNHSIGSSEAAWRLFQFEMLDRYQSVKRLGVRLERQQ